MSAIETITDLGDQWMGNILNKIEAKANRKKSRKVFPDFFK